MLLMFIMSTGEMVSQAIGKGVNVSDFYGAAILHCTVVWNNTYP